jgi:MIP family channel proteins
MQESNIKAYVAEFVGTFLLVGFICGLLSVWVGPGMDGPGAAGLGLLHAALLIAIIYGIGTVSGAHVNPAITIAMWSIRKISPRDAAGYIVAQLLGGIAGAFMIKGFFTSRGSISNYGAAHVSNAFLHGGSPWLALICEALGAFVLVWAVMATVVNKDAVAGFAGVAIGLSLGFAVMVFGPVTGGSFNPARWLGPALASGTFPDFWIYIVGPIAGAVLAASLYQWLIGSDNETASTDIKQ